MKNLILAVVITFLLSASNVQAQDFCKGDFNYDGAVGADDVTEFLNHFGRNAFTNPCPPDGPAPCAKTGQTTSYATGDDGDHQRGVALVTPRFTDNGDGTVTDNQTGLIWMKDADCYGVILWIVALGVCNQLEDGLCGLTDGSIPGDWRLPNYKELISLVDLNNYGPALPSSHPFDFGDEEFFLYWSSSTYAFDFDYVWYVGMGNAKPDTFRRDSVSFHSAWCVRGGH